MSGRINGVDKLKPDPVVDLDYLKSLYDPNWRASGNARRHRIKIIDHHAVAAHSRGKQLTFKFEWIEDRPEEGGWMLGGMSDPLVAGSIGPVMYGFHHWLVEWIRPVAREDEVEDLIEQWHTEPEISRSGLELHEFLGWSWDEYKAYVEKGEVPAT